MYIEHDCHGEDGLICSRRGRVIRDNSEGEMWGRGEGGHETRGKMRRDGGDDMGELEIPRKDEVG